MKRTAEEIIEEKLARMLDKLGAESEELKKSINKKLNENEQELAKWTKKM